MWKFVLYQKAPPFMGELSNEVRLRGNISRHLPAPSYSPCFLPRSGRSAPAPSPANRIGLRCKKLEIDPGSAHKVVARWRRGACLQLPVLELLRFAASSTGRAQLRNVASQLVSSWPGKRSKYQIAQKQTARFCVLFAFVVSGSYLQLILPYRSH